MSARAFRPYGWAIALVVLLGGLTAALGAWQLQRGFAKADLLQRFASAEAQAPRELGAGDRAERGVIERVRARGSFDGERQLLLDNQSRNRVPGYRVWTPLRLVDGGIAVVDRGWVPADGDRSKLPALPVPPDEVSVVGFWRALPQPGMRLEVDNCAGAAWPRIVQYPTVEELRCLYGASVPDGMLLMDADVPGGFVRDGGGASPGLSPGKHYAYAAQWFVFTLLLLFFFIKFSFRSRHDG